MNKIITKHLLFNYGKCPYQCWVQHLGVSSAYTLAKQLNRNIRFPVPVLAEHIDYNEGSPVFIHMLKNFKCYHKWLGTVVKISFTLNSCYMYIKWRGVPPPNLDKIRMSPSFYEESIYGVVHTPTKLLHVAIVENPNIPNCGKLDYGHFRLVNRY